MTNREWLNTLSDEEQLKEMNLKMQEIADKLNMRYNKTMTAKDLILSMQEFFAWYEAPHSQTADEDFAEIGFYPLKNTPNFKTYSDIHEREVFVSPSEIIYTSGKMAFRDIDIDQIRTIADKKRKEIGWNR